MSPDDRWMDPYFKDEVDQKIGYARGWRLNGPMWFDGDRNTGYSLHRPHDPFDSELCHYTPTSNVEQAIEAAQRIQRDTGYPFEMRLDGKWWTAGFDVRGRQSLMCREYELPHAICAAIVKIDAHRRRAGSGRRRRRGRGRGGHRGAAA